MDEQNPLTITITGTTVTLEGEAIIGFALNNLVNTLTATTDQSEEWNYTLTVHMIVQDVYNVINLDRSGKTLSVDLTADMLPYSGRYEMQFVATNGDYVSHTDIFEVFVKNTLDPVKQYTPVPSEFYQIQKDVQQNAQLAQNSANQAEQSATEAEGYATQAQQSVQDASGYLTQVQESANEAEQSAAQAGESARVAQEAAQQALGSVLPPATGLPDGYSLQTQGGQAVWRLGEKSIPSEPQISFTTQEDVQSISFDKIGDTPLSAYEYTYAFVQVENNPQSENKTSEFVGSINGNYTHISAGTGFIYQNTKKYFVGTLDTSKGIAMSVNPTQNAGWRGNVQIMVSPVFPGETIKSLNFRSNIVSTQIPVGTIIKVWLA